MPGNTKSKPMKNPHAGHRERMRARVRANGFRGFAEHEIMEYILFHVIPRANTNEIGHALIDTFGSVREVLRATYEELIRVPGVGRSSADFIIFLRELLIALDYYETEGASLNTPEERCDYFVQKLDYEQEEVVIAACLDDSMRVRHQFVVARGSIGQVNLNHQSLLKGIMYSHCRLVVLAHNHPMGSAFPSYEDVSATAHISEVLSQFGVRLIDHIIVAQGKAVSMIETGAYSPPLR
ncbi:MAG: RadC family protein [Oscillospiraceae bacterium]|nr:RadC family protein [Oscillospiraceae bacterium]